MSDTRARCPNCAWAFWHARALDLPSNERLILFAIAERADADLHCKVTQEMLREDTGLSERVISPAVQSLAKRGNCIRLERHRDGWHYFLLRPIEAHPKPRSNGEWRGPWYDDVPDSELRSPQVTNPIVTESDLRNPQVVTKSADQDLRNPQIPLMKSPLKDSPVETPSGLDARERASASPPVVASNVVALPTTTDPQRVFEAWNAVAERCDLPRVLRPGPAVRAKLATLIRNRGIEDVLRAIEAVGASSWCTGNNDGGWRADLYFVLQAKSFERLLSGYYADRPGRARVRPGTHAAFEQKYGLGPMQPTFDPEPDDAGRIAQ